MLTQEKQISGLPVISIDNTVVGIVTNRDLRFETKLDQPVSNIMTPKNAGEKNVDSWGFATKNSYI